MISHTEYSCWDVFDRISKINRIDGQGRRPAYIDKKMEGSIRKSCKSCLRLLASNLLYQAE